MTSSRGGGADDPEGTGGERGVLGERVGGGEKVICLN